MHGSVSPSKYGRLSSASHFRCAFTRAIAVRASSLDGSKPISRSSASASIVIIQPGSAGPPNQPYGDCRSSSARPQPSFATCDRSVATTSSDSLVRSRMTCQQIAGSPFKSQRVTLASLILRLLEPVIQRRVRALSEVAFKAALSAQSGKFLRSRIGNDKPRRFDSSVLDASPALEHERPFARAESTTESLHAHEACSSVFAYKL